MLEKVNLLISKDNKAACRAMKELQKESEISNKVYAYMDRFIDMIDNKRNSYIRTRGLVLIASNAKWDIDNKIDEIIDKYLRHITDIKPITSRQCIRMLPTIVNYKRELKEDIIKALENADVNFYSESMRPLVEKDIRETLKKIAKI